LFRRRRNPSRSAVDRDADRVAGTEILIVCDILADRDRERLIDRHANSDAEGDGHSVRAANIHVSGSAPDDRELYRLPDGQRLERGHLALSRRPQLEQLSRRDESERHDDAASRFR
jgi:hypothetical protein